MAELLQGYSGAGTKPSPKNNVENLTNSKYPLSQVPLVTAHTGVTKACCAETYLPSLSYDSMSISFSQEMH